jgi:hypothetical protein
MKGHKALGGVVALWLCLLCWPLTVRAQTFLSPPLSESQYNTLKIDITQTNASEFGPLIATSNFPALADAYNLPAAPEFLIYRGKVSRLEILFGTSSEGTVFTWTTNGFLTRTLQEIEAWRELFSRGDDATAPGQANVQQALQAIFSGPAGSDAAKNRQHIANIARRPATRAERLFVTSGTGTKADAGILAWEGTVNTRDIAHSLISAPLN